MAPMLRAGLISRKRLVEQLEEGLQSGRRLSIVSAQAGYGKTTLVNQWLTNTHQRVSWYCLEAVDNDPAYFFKYLVTAIRKVAGEVGQATESMLGTPQLPSADILVTLLINDLAFLQEKIILVLDDYHVIKNEFIHSQCNIFWITNLHRCIWC